MASEGTHVPYDKKTDSGDFEPKYTDEEFKKAIRGLDDPTGKNIAEEVGCATTTADQRLKKLEEAGELESEKERVARIWRVVD